MGRPSPADPASWRWVPQTLTVSQSPCRPDSPAEAGKAPVASALSVVQLGTEPLTPVPEPVAKLQLSAVQPPTPPHFLPSAKPDHHPRTPHFPNSASGILPGTQVLMLGFLLMAYFPGSSPEIQPGAPIGSGWHRIPPDPNRWPA